MVVRYHRRGLDALSESRAILRPPPAIDDLTLFRRTGRHLLASSPRALLGRGIDGREVYGLDEERALRVLTCDRRSAAGVGHLAVPSRASARRRRAVLCLGRQASFSASGRALMIRRVGCRPRGSLPYPALLNCPRAAPAEAPRGAMQRGRRSLDRRRPPAARRGGLPSFVDAMPSGPGVPRGFSSRHVCVTGPPVVLDGRGRPAASGAGSLPESVLLTDADLPRRRLDVRHVAVAARSCTWLPAPLRETAGVPRPSGALAPSAQVARCSGARRHRRQPDWAPNIRYPRRPARQKRLTSDPLVPTVVAALDRTGPCSGPSISAGGVTQRCKRRALRRGMK